MAALTAIVLTVFALTICNADAADATTRQVTYVFGDSMAEVGNNNYLPNALAKSNYPWYGVDYIKGQPTGRFTNGRTVGDIMCKLKGYQKILNLLTRPNLRVLLNLFST